MPCNLLHVVADPDPQPYADSEVKDVVGHLPRFKCAHCDPLRDLAPSEAIKCVDREEPCWKPADSICG